MLYFIYSVQHYANVFWKKLAEAVPKVMGQHEFPKLQICCNLSKILGGLEDDTYGNTFFPPFIDELYYKVAEHVPGARLSS